MTIKLPKGFFTRERYWLKRAPPFVVVPRSAAETAVPEPFLDKLELTKEGYLFPYDKNLLVEQIDVVGRFHKKAQRFALKSGSGEIISQAAGRMEEFIDAMKALFECFEPFERAGPAIFSQWEWGIEVPGTEYHYPGGKVPKDVKKFVRGSPGKRTLVYLKDLDLHQLALLLIKLQEEGKFDEHGDKQWFYQFEVAKAVYKERARAAAP